MAIDRLITNAGESASQNTTSVYDLSGAINGTYQTFAASPLAGTENTYIRIRSTDSEKYEVLEATFSTGTPDQFTRVTTIESSNADSAVDFGTESLEIIGSVTPGQKWAGNALEVGNGGLVGVSTDGIQTDELDLSIAPTWTGSHTFNADMTLGGVSQDWVFPSVSNNALHLQAQGADTNASLLMFSADGDGTDNVSFQVFGVGTPGNLGDRERLRAIYESSGRFLLQSEAFGTGTLRPLHIFSGTVEDNDDNQIVARTDGNVAMANSLKVGGTGAASGGTLEVAGDININPSNTYSPTNDTTDRTFDANSTTTAELADVLATLIKDLGMDA